MNMVSTFYIWRKKHGAGPWNERKEYRNYSFKIVQDFANEAFRPIRNKKYGLGWFVRMKDNDEFEWAIFFDGDPLLQELMYRNYLKERRKKK